MLSWLESTKTLQLYREWRAKRLLLAAAEKALRDEEQQLKARGIVSPVSYNWQVADARQIAERRYSAFVTHLSLVMTAYWLPVAAVLGLLVTAAAIGFGWWWWAHPVVPKP